MGSLRRVLTGAALAATSIATMTFAAGEEKFPFPQHQTFKGCTKPSISQTEMDNAVVAAYNSYKGYMKGPTADGGYYIYQANNSKSQKTTSEAHSYAMAIFALMAGQDASAKTYFDGCVKFYLDHPSKYGNPKGMNWAPTNETAQETSSNGGDAATDGDMGIAYALILADRQWGSDGTYNYLQMSKDLLKGMLGCPELGNSNNKIGIADDDDNSDLTRSSDWIIDHLSTFAGIDNANKNKYNDIINQIHKLLETPSICNSKTGLLPGFALADKPDSGSEGGDEMYYASNACRTPWRIAMGYMHSGDETAKAVAIKQANWAYGVSKTFALKDGGYTLDGTALHSGWANATAKFVAPYAVSAQLTGNQDMVNAAWKAAVNASIGATQEEDPEYDQGIRVLSLLAASGNWWNPINVVPPTITCSVIASANGSVDWAPKKDSYAKTDVVTITAKPAGGYIVDKWEGDVSGLKFNGDNTSATVTMEQAHTINVSFKKPGDTGPANLVLEDSCDGYWEAMGMSGATVNGKKIEFKENPDKTIDTLSSDDKPFKDNEVVVSCVIPKCIEAKNYWPGVEIMYGQEGSLTGLTKVIITYKSPVPITLRLDQQLKNSSDGKLGLPVAQLTKELPASAAAYVTKEVALGDFAVDQYAVFKTTKDEEQNAVEGVLDLEKDSIITIAIDGDDKKAISPTINIKEFRLVGVKTSFPEGILDNNFAVKSAAKITSNGSTLTLTTPVVGNYDVEIYQIDGSLVRKVTTSANGGTASLDLTGLASGVYVAKVKGAVDFAGRFSITK